MSRIKGAIFDVDGTLVDSNDAHTQAWHEALRAGGFRVDAHEIRKLIGMGGDKLFPRVTGGLSADSELGKKINQHRADIFKLHFLPKLKPFAEVRPLLQKMLARGMVLATASSAPMDELKKLLEIANVADLFAASGSSSDTSNSKPDPDIVIVAQKKLGLEASETIMIGDTPYDIAAAMKADMKSIGFLCGGWEAADLRGATAIFADPSDLLTSFAKSLLA